MTIMDYLQYPNGKGSAVGKSNTEIREQYAVEYVKLEKLMKHRIYLFRKHVIYHIIIPSRDEHSDVTYDVLIEIDLGNLSDLDVNTSNTDVSVFSNCPSFIFSFAHIFHSHKLLCKWLVNKYNEEVRKKFPTTRNKYGVIGAERSLYLAMLYIKNNNLDRRDTVKITSDKVHSYSAIAQRVRTQNEIMEHYRNAKITNKTPNSASEAKKAKLEKKIAKETKKTKTGVIKSVMTTKNTKSSKAIKKTKKF